MMKVFLSPQRSDDSLVMVKAGDVLQVNGLLYDFSQLPDGHVLEDAMPTGRVFGNVTREDGVIMLNVIMPIPADPTQQQAFPSPVFIEQDGRILLPTDSGQLPAILETSLASIDWSRSISIEEVRLREREPFEKAWQVDELAVIANQLLAIEEDALDAMPGTRKQWLAYRTLVRLWHESPNFPDQFKRPDRPT